MAIAEDLVQLERKLDTLKVEYEHYFSGRARLEPNELRGEVDRLVQRWTGKPINNTMYKFRYRNLVGRYNSLSAYWNRCLREIEEGTFKRDRFRMDLQDREARDRAERRKKLDARIASREGGNEASPPGGHDALYRELLAAKESCGQSTAGLDRREFEEVLRRQREQVRARFACDDVEFKVSVEESTVRLIVRPVKEDGSD
jgi:hypothetical protein